MRATARWCDRRRVTHSEMLIRSRRQLLVTVDGHRHLCCAFPNFTVAPENPERGRPRQVRADELRAVSWAEAESSHFSWPAASCLRRRDAGVPTSTMPPQCVAQGALRPGARRSPAGNDFNTIFG
jgi:hypothetical protein